MLDLLIDPNAWAALVTLSVLEIVLGIDNVVFISILVTRLSPAQSRQARRIGLSLALVFRIGFLFLLTWLIGLKAPVLAAFGWSVSWHDIILIGGGLFLIAKATHEIHREMEPADGDGATAASGTRPFLLTILQIVVVDLVFSVDSIVTAIGMAQDIRIMIAAVLVAVAVMYLASGHVAAFIARHPTTKMLALAFLLLIGVALVADGLAFHIPRGYIYFSMAFAAVVEVANVIVRRRRGIDDQQRK